MCWSPRTNDRRLRQPTQPTVFWLDGLKINAFRLRANAAPSTRAEPRRPVTKVASTTNCTPPNNGRPSAMISNSASAPGNWHGQIRTLNKCGSMRIEKLDELAVNAIPTWAHSASEAKPAHARPCVPSTGCGTGAQHAMQPHEPRWLLAQTRRHRVWNSQTIRKIVPRGRFETLDPSQLSHCPKCCMQKHASTPFN